MSFSLAFGLGPARLVSRAPQQLSRLSLARPNAFTPSSRASRALHNATKNPRPSTFFSSKTAAILSRPAVERSSSNVARLGASPSSPFAARDLLGRLSGAGRGYYQGGPGGSYQAVPPVDSSTLLRKLLVGSAIFGGTVAALHVVFNRETRTDGGMPFFERQYLNSTFLHTGLGIGIIGVTARQMIQSGFVYRIMVTSPWVVAIGGLALSFGTMIGARSVDPDNYMLKYGLWTAFNATQAAFVAPMLAFVPGALLARAGLYTVAMMGSLSFVGATAKQEKYLYIGGPLLAGCGVLLAAGLAPLVIPATAVRTLALTESLWLYGGLALFGGFTLYDVQKILHHARLAERGVIKRDPVAESISLELDFINIFIRMVQILMMQQGGRKK